MWSSGLDRVSLSLTSYFLKKHKKTFLNREASKGLDLSSDTELRIRLFSCDSHLESYYDPKT